MARTLQCIMQQFERVKEIIRMKTRFIYPFSFVSFDCKNVICNNLWQTGRSPSTVRKWTSVSPCSVSNPTWMHFFRWVQCSGSGCDQYPRRGGLDRHLHHVHGYPRRHHFEDMADLFDNRVIARPYLGPGHFEARHFDKDSPHPHKVYFVHNSLQVLSGKAVVQE